MAIPDNRLSTEPIPDDYIDPDGRDRSLNEDYEAGPIAVIDTSEGLFYQPWKLTFVGGDFIITPETTGSPVTVLSGQDSEQCSFAFDQNARPTLAWIDSLGIARLYWYDSTVANFVTTVFGEMKSVMLSLDDKRVLQVGASDIIFWYTLDMGGSYTLYHRQQRDRFGTPYEMLADALPFLYKTGMHKGLRGQILLGGPGGTTPPPPTPPPEPPTPQANLDFELGPVYWNTTGAFVIDPSTPYQGSWAAVLDMFIYTPSTMENSAYTSFTPGDELSVSCIVKSTVATQIRIGVKYYDENKAYISTATTLRSVPISWVQITHTAVTPLNAIYARIFVESTALTNGRTVFDNFTFENLDANAFFTVELGAPVYFEVDLAATELFEVEA